MHFVLSPLCQWSFMVNAECISVCVRCWVTLLESVVNVVFTSDHSSQKLEEEMLHPTLTASWRHAWRTALPLHTALLARKLRRVLHSSRCTRSLSVSIFVWFLLHLDSVTFTGTTRLEATNRKTYTWLRAVEHTWAHWTSASRLPGERPLLEMNGDILWTQQWTSGVCYERWKKERHWFPICWIILKYR